MKRKRADGSGENRIVAHVDLDCFYVQVERSINPALKDKAVGVVQYNPFGDLKSYAPEDNRLMQSGSLIAVSYEARARGVKRNMRGAEAKKVCPEMLLVQVPTSHGKADLTIYRDASARILNVLCSKYTSCIVERSSIDEVYLDVSAEAAKLLEESDPDTFLPEAIRTLLAVPSMIAGDDAAEVQMSRRQISKGHSGTELLAGSYQQGTLNTTTATTTNTTNTATSNTTTSNTTMTSNTTPIEPASPLFTSPWFARPPQEWSIDDKLLLAGALVINQLRIAVYEELGFTCSAGIANNKILAKLSSAMHKPNKQTLAPACVIPKLMTDLPISRIQGLGGKLGHTIESIYGDKVRTMGQILTTPRHELVQHFGDETATWLHSVARGIDHEPVLNRSLPISIGCSKSFRSTMMLHPHMIMDGTVLHWLTQLAGELQERVAADTKANSRIPRNLNIGVSVKIFPNGEIPVHTFNNSSSSGANGGNVSVTVVSGSGAANATSTSNTTTTCTNTTNTTITTNPTTTTTNTTSTTNNTNTEPDEIANWHEQAGFSLSKIVPLQTQSSTSNTARTAFVNIVRTILEHPKFTAVYGSVQIPLLATIQVNNVSSSVNTYNTDGTSLTTTSANATNTILHSPTKSTRTTITSPHTDKHTLPTGWAITGLSLAATNFTTVESGASSIKSYFGTSVKSESGDVAGSSGSSGSAGSGSGGSSASSGNSNNNIDGVSGTSTTLSNTNTSMPAVPAPTTTKPARISDMFAHQRATYPTTTTNSTDTNTDKTHSKSALLPPPTVVPPVAVSIRDMIMQQKPKQVQNTRDTNTTTIGNTVNSSNAVCDLTDDTLVHISSDTNLVIGEASCAIYDVLPTTSTVADANTTSIPTPTTSSTNTIVATSMCSDNTTTTTFTKATTADCNNTNTTTTSTTTTTANTIHSQHQPRSMGDIDYTVFLTLPPEIQKEIELTMKLRAQTQQSTHSSRVVQGAKGKGGMFGGTSSVGGGSGSGVSGSVSGGVSAGSTRVSASATANECVHSSCATSSSTVKKETHQPDTMMDVDSAVFLSLPSDIQREIELTMKLRQQRRNSGASTHIHRQKPKLK